MRSRGDDVRGVARVAEDRRENERWKFICTPSRARDTCSLCEGFVELMMCALYVVDSETPLLYVVRVGMR